MYSAAWDWDVLAPLFFSFLRAEGGMELMNWPLQSLPDQLLGSVPPLCCFPAAQAKRFEAGDPLVGVPGSEAGFALDCFEMFSC